MGVIVEMRHSSYKNNFELNVNMSVETRKSEYVWRISANVKDANGQTVRCDVLQLHAHVVGTDIYHPGPEPYQERSTTGAGMSWRTSNQNFEVNGGVYAKYGGVEFTLDGSILKLIIPPHSRQNTG